MVGGCLFLCGVCVVGCVGDRWRSRSFAGLPTKSRDAPDDDDDDHHDAGRQRLGDGSASSIFAAAEGSCSLQPSSNLSAWRSAGVPALHPSNSRDQRCACPVGSTLSGASPRIGTHPSFAGCGRTHARRLDGDERVPQPADQPCRLHLFQAVFSLLLLSLFPIPYFVFSFLFAFLVLSPLPFPRQVLQCPHENSGRRGQAGMRLGGGLCTLVDRRDWQFPSIPQHAPAVLQRARKGAKGRKHAKWCVETCFRRRGSGARASQRLVRRLAAGRWAAPWVAWPFPLWVLGSACQP